MKDALSEVAPVVTAAAAAAVAVAAAAVEAALPLDVEPLFVAHGSSESSRFVRFTRGSSDAAASQSVMRDAKDGAAAAAAAAAEAESLIGLTERMRQDELVALSTPGRQQRQVVENASVCAMSESGEEEEERSQTAEAERGTKDLSIT